MTPTLTERVARAIMLARNEPGCEVVNWQREALDNPHVSQAINQAQAAIQATRVEGLAEALERLIIAVDWETMPIYDGVDVKKRARILMQRADTARQALVVCRGE